MDNLMQEKEDLGNQVDYAQNQNEYVHSSTKTNNNNITMKYTQSKNKNSDNLTNTRFKDALAKLLSKAMIYNKYNSK